MSSKRGRTFRATRRGVGVEGEAGGEGLGPLLQPLDAQQLVAQRLLGRGQRPRPPETSIDHCAPCGRRCRVESSDGPQAARPAITERTKTDKSLREERANTDDAIRGDRELRRARGARRRDRQGAGGRGRRREGGAQEDGQGSAPAAAAREKGRRRRPEGHRRTAPSAGNERPRTTRCAATSRTGRTPWKRCWCTRGRPRTPTS